MMVSTLTAAGGCPMPAAMIAFREHVRITEPVLRLGAAADLGALPAGVRSRANRLALARVATGRSRLSTLALAARARGLMPVLGCWTKAAAGITLVDRARGATGQPDVIRETATHSEGVAKGDRLTIMSRVGAVRVTRAVEALQAARAGGRLFVRDDEGRIISARYAADAR